MAVKTFTTGEVLTAADTNTYLANAGLVHVKGQTVGTAVSTVTVTNAFSSTYDAYRIVYSGGSSSALQAVALQMGTTNTNYYFVLYYNTYGAAPTTLVNAVGGSASWAYVGEMGNGNVICVDVYNPYATEYTKYTGQYVGSVTGTTGGELRNTTSYTDFNLTVAGTITGGQINVYGYRKG
jgi:hypothetical protein